MEPVELWFELLEREREWFAMLCLHGPQGYHVFGSSDLPPRTCLIARIMLSDRARQCRN